MKFVIRIVVCAIIGYLESIVCEKGIVSLLNKRNRSIEMSKKEQRLLAAVMAAGGAVLGYKFDSVVMLVYSLVLLGISEMIAVIDWHHRIIPNELWQAIIFLKLAFCIPTFFGVEGFLQLNLWDSVLGIVVCFFVFAAPRLYKKAVGAGDIKLAAAIGFGLGLTNALLAIVLMGVCVLVYTTSKKNIAMLKVLE